MKMIEKLKQEYDRQWNTGIRQPILVLTKGELKQYYVECSKFWKSLGYSGKLNKNSQFFRNAKLEVKHEIN